MVLYINNMLKTALVKSCFQLSGEQGWQTTKENIGWNRQEIMLEIFHP